MKINLLHVLCYKIKLLNYPLGITGLVIDLFLAVACHMLFFIVYQECLEVLSR